MNTVDETLGQGKSYQRSNPWPELIVAMLSVNNFPLTRTFAIFQGLDASGLFEPRSIAQWDLSEIARRLGTAGYDRGFVLTRIVAERILSLKAIMDDVDGSELILARGSRAEVAELLGRVKGVGPKVLDNFFLIRGPEGATCTGATAPR